MVNILSVRLTCKAQGDKIYIEQKEKSAGIKFCEFAFYNVPRLKFDSDIKGIYTNVNNDIPLAILATTTSIENIMKSIIPEIPFELIPGDPTDDAYLAFVLTNPTKVSIISIVCPSLAGDFCSDTTVRLYMLNEAEITGFGSPATSTILA